MKSFNFSSKSLSFWAIGILFFTFQACVRVPVKREPCQADPGVYRRALEQLSRQYKGVSGKIKVRVLTPEGNFSFSGILYACSPDKLHFDVFGFLHRPRFLLVKNGGLIAWLDYDTGRRYQGPLEGCPGFPVKFPFSPMFLKDFLRILFLDFPFPVEILPVRESSESCKFSMTCRWGTFKAVFDPQLNLPVSLVGPEERPDIFQITFSRYTKEGRLTIPWAYGIAVGDTEMEITFKSLEVNPVFPPGVFNPVLP